MRHEAMPEQPKSSEPKENDLFVTAFVQWSAISVSQNHQHCRIRNKPTAAVCAVGLPLYTAGWHAPRATHTLPEKHMSGADCLSSAALLHQNRKLEICNLQSARASDDENRHVLATKTGAGPFWLTRFFAHLLC